MQSLSLRVRNLLVSYIRSVTNIILKRNLIFSCKERGCDTTFYLRSLRLHLCYNHNDSIGIIVRVLYGISQGATL